MAAGDLSVRPEVKSRYGEIGQLATDFAKMREQLKDDIAMLEFRIAQRTMELRQSEERLEFAIASVDAGIWDWELSKGCVTRDKRWAAALGYPDKELHLDEDSYFEMVHPDDVTAVRSGLEDHRSRLRRRRSRPGRRARRKN